jgi:L-amino acid N-acyltransferase YncA
MTEEVLTIRPMREADWARVADIYAEGLATGNATFETDVPSWESWNTSHLASCRLIAEASGMIVGWAALSGVSDRCVYGGVAEISVYVDDEARGRGVGTRLLDALVKGSETEGLWTLQAGIFAENVASLRIHEKCGFRIVGTRERLGKLDGRWRDVLLLERRSRVVGT